MNSALWRRQFSIKPWSESFAGLLTGTEDSAWNAFLKRDVKGGRRMCAARRVKAPAGVSAARSSVVIAAALVGRITAALLVSGQNKGSSWFPDSTNFKCQPILPNSVNSTTWLTVPCSSDAHLNAYVSRSHDTLPRGSSVEERFLFHPGPVMHSHCSLSAHAFP